MNRKKFRIFLCVLLALAGLTVMASTAAGGAGSQDDPLVTLSYLTETFTGQVMERVDQLIGQQGGGGAGAYTAVTLGPGQTLHGRAGCEVVLCSGRARCAASAAPGLVDATLGAAVSGGAELEANHLYMMTDERAVTSAEGAVLLVRGGYSVL